MKKDYTGLIWFLVGIGLGFVALWIAKAAQFYLWGVSL